LAISQCEFVVTKCAKRRRLSNKINADDLAEKWLRKITGGVVAECRKMEHSSGHEVI